MKILLALLSLVASSLSPLLAVDFTDSVVIIPIAGRLAGAQGSLWRTDLTVTNPSRRNTIGALISFIPEGGTNTAVKGIELRPRETLRFTDIVLTEFGYQEMTGVIEVSGLSGQRVAARAYIYNVGNPCGQYGQVAPGLPTALMSFNSALPDLPGPPTARTNVGITNPGLSEAFASVSYFNREGDQLGGFSIQVPPKSVRQFNDVYAYLDVPADPGLTIEVRSSNVALYVWASSVRNDTGDATFIIGHEVLE